MKLARSNNFRFSQSPDFSSVILRFYGPGTLTEYLTGPLPNQYFCLGEDRAPLQTQKLPQRGAT